MEALGSMCSISPSHSFLLFIVLCLFCLYTLYSSSIISFPILLFAEIVRHCLVCAVQLAKSWPLSSFAMIVI